jgi:BirA family biotin operon repressor/biotin-[acetyl-CoA-carboxylase] ligase
LSESTSYFERFRRMMDAMEFESLPLFSKPQFSWNLKTDYVGRRFIYRPSTESTMEDARRMLERWRVGHGAIVLAETQTAGRGRAGRSWVSPPDVNLHFTLMLVPPSKGLRPLPFVTPLATALAVEEVAAKYGSELRVDLKWPNDILIGERKLGGVLIETAPNSEGATVALIGVGVNVNLDVASYAEIADIAVSVKDAIGFEVAREEILAAFCNHFESLYEDAIAGDDVPFYSWKDRLVTLGRDVVATGSGSVIKGRAVDVAEDGALLIQQPDGRRVRVEAGDVTLSAS